MSYELSEIKLMRKKYGITQTELAKKANVSQSIIAKIESGRVDPSYSATKKIFDVLHYLGEKHEAKVSEVMNKKVVSINPNEDIESAIRLMKKYEISQLPVIDDHKVVGVVSESIILEALLEKKPKKVSDIMQDSPPIISEKTSINVVSGLLRYYPIVIVSCDGKVCGVVTKSDIIRKMYR